MATLKNSIITRGLRMTALLGGVLLVSMSMVGPSALAAPPGQAVCVTVPPNPSVFFPPGVPTLIPGAVVTTDGRRNAVVHFSADVRVAAGSELRILWSIDGTLQPAFAFGPSNLANTNFAGFAEARALMNVIPLGPGRHSIQAVGLLQGPGCAQMFGSCLSVGSNIK